MSDNPIGPLFDHFTAWFGTQSATEQSSPHDLALEAFFKGAAFERREIERLRSSRAELVGAATKWPRCCDLHQDGFGTFACLECQQKTFAMMRKIQSLLGVDKNGDALTNTKEPS